MIENRIISLFRKSKSLTTKLYSSISTPQSRFYSSIPAPTQTSASRSFFTYGLCSLRHNNYKDFSVISFRNFSTAGFASARDAGELKLLLTAGPHAQKAVSCWLYVSAVCVLIMVVLGGVARLTKSGLSMTDWKFTGSLPPLSDEEWLIEFEKYKQSPEYKRVNKGMTLAHFKAIYWMEYAHQMWGRALGIVFALPFSYFLLKRYITPRLGLGLSGLFALGAVQGLVGWWMVKSGLEEPKSENVEPRVSPYRLAAHLTSALVIYSGLLKMSLSVSTPDPPALSIARVREAAKVSHLALPIGILVGLTAVSGAFVAGNDEGLSFSTSPNRGNACPEVDLPSIKLFLSNFFQNTSTASFYHRGLATATLISLGGLWWSTRKLDIHPVIHSSIRVTLGMAILQVATGIIVVFVQALQVPRSSSTSNFSNVDYYTGLSTLKSFTAVLAGTVHQFGALALLTQMIYINHWVRRPSKQFLQMLINFDRQFRL